MNQLKWHDWLLIVLSLVIATATAVFVIINYDKIPEKIPTNYDFQGNVTGYGSKSNVIVLLVMAFIMPVITTILQFFPQTWNMPTVKPQNVPQAMAITGKIIEGVTLAVTVLMAYLAITMTGLIPFTSTVLTLSTIAIVLITAIGLIKYFKLK